MFATIQKFMPGDNEDTFYLRSDRHNRVAIADAAHRTQYGFEAKPKVLKRSVTIWRQPLWNWCCSRLRQSAKPGKRDLKSIESYCFNSCLRPY